MNVSQVRTVEREYQGCDLCDLCDNRKHYPHFGMGHPESSILVVMPEPYVTEETASDEKKLYDNGTIQKSHRLYKPFTSLLKNAGVSKLDVYITSSIMCPVKKGDRPSKDQILKCRDRLEKTVQAFNPKILVLCGPISYFSWFAEMPDDKEYGLVFQNESKSIFYTRSVDYFLDLKESKEYPEEEIHNLAMDLLEDWKEIQSLNKGE